MASERAFKYFRYKEQQAFLKWKRMSVRGREIDLLKDLTDLDMPAWKKRRLIRDVIYYSACSEFQPLTGLGVYDYTPEVERMSDAASFSFEESSTAGSTPTASSSAEDSTDGSTPTASSSAEDSTAGSTPVASSSAEDSRTGTTGATDAPAASRSSGQVESPLAESVHEAAPKSTVSQTSEQVDSPLAESVNEASPKSTASQTSERVESSAAESVNEAAPTSTVSRTSERVESSAAESVNKATPKSTASQTSGPVDSSLKESEYNTDEQWMSCEGTPERTRRASEMVESSAAESVNEEVVIAPSSQTSEPVDSSLKESDYNTDKQWIKSRQGTPERTRRSEDCISEISQLSPVLSALKINRETSKKFEAEVFTEDSEMNSNVRFSKCGKLQPYRRKIVSFGTNCEGDLSNQLTTSDALDRAEANPSRMLLVPSNVQPKVQQLALLFAEHFGYRIMECDAIEGSFDGRVSHVIVDLEVPEPIQFAQCQAIGCRRYVVASDWLQESLKVGRVLTEDPFELIFCEEETGTSISAPSRLARLSPKNLFDGFAIVMCKPFDKFKESQMKRLLAINGARVCQHPRNLLDSPGEARICIVDSKYYQKRRDRKLLKQKSVRYKFVAVHYKWLFESFHLYQRQQLLRYLHDAEPEEALEAGVPESFL